MNFKVIQLIFWGLMFSVVQLYAQTDFRPGYVIKLDGDTLHGSIDYRGDRLMGERCKFLAKGSGDETDFYPADIAAYRFVGGKYFVSKTIDKKAVFLEYLIEGKVNIYYLRDKGDDRYYLQKSGSEIIELPYQMSVKQIDNYQYVKTSTKHLGILNYYMQDAPDFTTRIANMGKPEHESLIKLAEDYHNKVCKDTPCIIYEKKLPLFRVSLEVVAGLVQFNYIEYGSIDINNSGFNNQMFFNTGLLAHIWMPRVSEKLYVRTGVSAVLPFTDFVVKIPLQVEYIYPKYILKPKLAAGFNLYGGLYQTVAFMAGANIKLGNRAFLSVSYDVDFTHRELSNILPRELFSQSLLFGIAIKL